jgi:hypothetical protein
MLNNGPLLILDRGSTVKFEFFFTSLGLVYDPTSQDQPIDVIITVHRGEYGVGPIIDGPFSYLNQDPETEINRIEKISLRDFTFDYTIPSDLFEGAYTVLAQTSSSLQNISRDFKFQVKGEPTKIFPIIASSDKETVINYKPDYQDLSGTNTSTILLIGHADGLLLNNVVKINSIQEAINMLGADINSPLLRGIFDAYSCGAKEILICPAAPMSEYVSEISVRNVKSDIFDGPENLKSFYEKYYERLQETYAAINQLDFVDIVVPLEVSIINTGEVDFLTQLASYCSNFHDETGFVQMGIIGSRSTSTVAEDVQSMLSNSLLVNKFSIFSENGQLISDAGRYVIPVYGEIAFLHPQLKINYISSASAAVAGMVASNPLNRSMIRQRIPGAYAAFTGDLNQVQYNALDSIGVNIIYRGKRTSRSVPYEIYLSNEYNMANKNSVYSKVSQMKLIAAVVTYSKDIGRNALGKFGYDQLVSQFSNFLRRLKSDKAIIDFELKAFPDPQDKGKVYFDINLISALGLNSISLGLSAGPGA